MFRRTLAPALLVAGLLATAVAIGVGSNASHVSAITNCDTSGAAPSAAERQMLVLINQARMNVNLPPLKFSQALNRAAAWKSADPSATGTDGFPFSHTDSLGRNTIMDPPKNRAIDCGYPSFAAENILWGLSDPQAAFNEWMQSLYHRYNINGTNLDGTINQTYYQYAKGYVVIGIGLHGSAWTTDFGAVDDSGATAPPQPSTSTGATATPTNTPRPTNTPIPTPTPTQPPLPPAGIMLGLSAGMNLITYAGPDQPVGDATASIRGQLLGVYAWNPVSGQWDRFAPGVPAYAATINLLHNGQVYYVELSAAAVWVY
jgi:uncharacterized protein YkwD